jgi:hypothetical protein
MTVQFQIDCVRKDERAEHPHHAITPVGGRKTDGGRWELGIEQAIRGVMSGEVSFFTKEENQRAQVYCHKSPVHKDEHYLTTSPDGTTANNLLHLRTCPL